MKTLLTLLLLVHLFDTAAHAQDAAVARIEQSLAPAVIIEGGPSWNVEERMRFHKVPGLSVAVVDGGKVVWAKGYGQANIRANRPVTTKTMFLAGSVSKPVTAVAAVDLVERGKVPFDADVNTVLKSWQLPQNELTAKTPVTLRQLFSHSGGTTVHGFPGYPRSFARPTVKQVLSGEGPANTPAVLVDLAPNTQFRYSGGGTTVAQQALSDATGLDFATLMRRHVLGPLGMTNSTYAQPLPQPFHAQAAIGYRTLDRAIPGGWHVYPEAAAAGLWTTPSDLAKVIVEMHDALAGGNSKVLRIDGARLMLTPRFSSGGPTRYVGVGWFLEQRGGASYFGHNGVDEAFDALLIATADGSKGAVLMANTNGSLALMEEFVRAIAREYDWPGYLNIAPPVAKMPEELLTRLPGRYRLDPNRVVPIRRNGDALELVTLAAKVPLHYLSDGTFARHDFDERFRFTDAGLEVIAGGKTTVATRTDDPLTPLELLADNRVDDAIAALKAMPNSTQTTMRLGFNLLRLGRERDAIRLFELNVAANPTSANDWDNLSSALLQAGEYERAAEATRKILEFVETDKTLDDRTRLFLRPNAKIRLHEIEAREEQ